MQDQIRYYDIIIRDLQNANVDPIIRDIKSSGSLSSEKKYLRLWKLGSLDHKIYPTEKAFVKLKEVLEKWDGYSTIDIIWDCALTVEVIEI